MIVFDPVLKRPGCVLLQAVMGGTIPEFMELFDSYNWLTSPTPDMKCYPVTEEQLQILSETYGTKALLKGKS